MWRRGYRKRQPRRIKNFRMRVGDNTHSLEYMPQLDSLRAIAVLAVVYTHFLTQKYWLFGIYWGGLGVRLFFVLSGFLITTVLLRDADKFSSFKSFYAAFLSRRALRLYPILLVTLCIAAALGIGPVRDTFVWHATYLTNFYIVKIGNWPVAGAHLWSLAVEEQFYLLWPMVVFFLPRRLLPLALVGLILIAPAFRLSWRSAGLGDLGAWVLTPGSFDSLAMGALIALFRRARTLFAIIGLVGFFVLATQSSWFIKNAGVFDTAWAMIFVWIVSRAAAGFRGIIGKVLDNQALQYVGSISYGIYVLHNFVAIILQKFTNLLPRWSLLLAAGTTMLLASASWHFLERPIMRLGRRRIAALKLAEEGRSRAVPSDSDQVPFGSGLRTLRSGAP